MFRPWGQSRWLLERIQSPGWTFLGCLGPEKRSLSCLQHLFGHLSSHYLVEILDGDKLHEEEERQALNVRRGEALASGALPDRIESAYLFDSLDRIDEVRAAALAGGVDVIIDITSLPKRWFFPLVKTVVED